MSRDLDQSCIGLGFPSLVKNPPEAMFCNEPQPLGRCIVRWTGRWASRLAILIQGSLETAFCLDSSFIKALPFCNEVLEVNHGERTANCNLASEGQTGS